MNFSTRCDISAFLSLSVARTHGLQSTLLSFLTESCNIYQDFLFFFSIMCQHSKEPCGGGDGGLTCPRQDLHSQEDGEISQLDWNQYKR